MGKVTPLSALDKKFERRNLTTVIQVAEKILISFLYLLTHRHRMSCYGPQTVLRMVSF